MPDVCIPAIALPYPTLKTAAPSASKTLVVYGASSSVSSKTIQITVAPGINVIAIAWPTTTTWLSAAELLKSLTTRTPWSSRASPTPSWRANSNSSPYSTPSPLRRRTLAKLGGGHLACVHPPPAENVPLNVETGMIFAVTDVATPVYRDSLMPALQSRKLKCLPPSIIVGKGLEHINDALRKSKAGVSATKLMVKL